MKNGFTTGVAADSGYALNEELTTRLNTAANIITTASNTLGADSTEVQTAQAALDSFFRLPRGRCSPMARSTHRTL